MPHADYVGELPGDVLALQEVRLTIDGMAIVEPKFTSANWQQVWGKPQPCRTNTPNHPNSPLDAKQGGVSLHVQHQHLAVPSPRTELGEELFETGRWQSTVIRVNGGTQLIHVITAYGFPRANDRNEEYESNETFLGKVFTEALSLGEVPVIVCGDFNIHVDRSQELSQRLISGQWRDAAAVYANANGEDPEPTYKFREVESRVDFVFMNPAAARALESVEVMEVPFHGIKRHKPLCVAFDFVRKGSTAWKTKKVKRLPEPLCTLTGEELNTIENGVLADYGELITGALADHDVNMAWGAWCEAAEQFLLERAATECGDLEILADPAYRGRGQCAQATKTTVGVGPLTQDGIALAPEVHGVPKLLRLLEQLENKKDLETWRKILIMGPEVIRNKTFRKYWKIAYPTMEELANMKVAIQMVLHRGRGDLRNTGEDYEGGVR